MLIWTGTDVVYVFLE